MVDTGIAPAPAAPAPAPMRPPGLVSAAVPRARFAAPGVADELLAVAVAATAWLAADLAPGFCRPAGTGVAGVILAGVGLVVLARARAAVAMLLAAAVVLGGVGLAAGARGVGAADGYRPRQAGPLPSPVEVLGDPEPVGVSGWRIEVRLPDGGRVEAVAHGRAGLDLSRARVGESLTVEGRLRPIGDRSWLRTRHLVAVATITEASVRAEPAIWRTAIEAIRHRVRAGGDGLSSRRQALYHGLVLGDDRFQPPGQTLRFRLSGLTHLLAVSGQNVAFVLAAAAPIIGRFGPRTRLLALIVVLVVFALMTRLEPSVLRAVSTAGLSAWAALTGRTRSGLGVLATAVAVLVLVDPFLVDSVGFQLSVAASAGILLLTPALTRLVPGPAWLVTPLATGLGAQIAVAPLLSHYFGPVSLVTIPANLAAGWAAAAVMIWGLTLGLVAGLAPPPVAAVIQWPVDLLLGWLETVAAVGARSPDPRPGLLVVAMMACCALAARALPGRWPGWTVLGSAVVVAVAAVPRAPAEPGVCGAGIAWFPPASTSERSVLVIGPEARLRSVESCRRLGIRSVDLVVTLAGDRSTGSLIGAVVEVVEVGQVLAPPLHSIVGARRQVDPVTIPTGWGRLVVEPRSGSDGRQLTTRLHGDGSAAIEVPP